MAINISKKQNVKIHVSHLDDILILVLRECTTEETFQYIKLNENIENLDVGDSSSYGLRLEFIDMLLMDIKALDVEGKEENVVYTDPETGEDKTLNSQVPDWKSHISTIIKLKALMQLSLKYFNSEPTKLKN